MEKYDDIILSHYKDQANRHGGSAESTMADLTTRKLETEFLLQFVSSYVPPDGLLADIGCGNGFTLAQVRDVHPNMRLVGLEFTPELKTLARKRFENDSKTTIQAADVRVPLDATTTFDAVICQRVLINLLNPVDQEIALANLVKSLKPGGVLAAIEAFETPLRNLNEARAEFGLDELSQAHHNLYLADDFFERNADLLPIVDRALKANFLSTHYFVSRVLHAMFIGKGEFIRNSHFVKFGAAALRQDVGDYSPVRGLIFQKK